MGLNYRQRLFAVYYLGKAAGNATEAARMAGFKWPDKYGPELLGNSRIQALIAQKVESAALPAEEVLARMADLASADLLPYLERDRNGEWQLDVSKLKAAGKGHLVRKLKASKDGVEVEIRDSLVALQRLGEYHGLWDRQKPPDVSLVELARRLREKYEHDRGGSVGRTDEST
jgi:phage terminase small subunit